MSVESEARHVHDGCMACGDTERNPHSLGLKFIETEGGAVETRFLPTSLHQGYDGCVHGGIIATLLDAAMTHCLFQRAIVAMTAELNIRYVAPVAIDREIRITAELLDQRRGVYTLKANITDGKRTLARATGKFMEV